MSDTMPNPNESLAQPRTWDPFQLMDRLDEEALRKELTRNTRKHEQGDGTNASALFYSAFVLSFFFVVS